MDDFLTACELALVFVGTWAFPLLICWLAS